MIPINSTKVSIVISNPIFSNFRFYLPENFLYDVVKDKFNLYFEQNGLPYNSITDYMNSTIKSVEIPGLMDNNTSEQATGNIKRTYQTAQRPEEKDKKFSVTFSTKNSFLNWLILRENFKYHVNDSGKPFLSPCFIQIMNEWNEIIFEVVLQDVQFGSIDKLSLQRQDLGILQRDFSVNMAFNGIDYKIHTDKLSKGRDKDKHEYTY